MLADLDMGGSVRDTEMKRRHVFNDRPFCTYKVCIYIDIDIKSLIQGDPFALGS